ncbi:MAG: hypothetical protein MOGMAGMI_01951 [Candidatus Omnitrophica bacterium]|nr:hypothetical protein [Candidatus Omnitrophota bacterium]
MDTFTVQDADDRRLFSQELPNTAVTGHPYLEHVAPLALFNPTGSGKTVRVRRAEVMPLMAQTTTTPGNYDLYRITAHTGTGDAIAAMKLDSNNAALPSQVVLARRPATVTTSGSQWDGARAIPLANDTRTLGYGFAATPWAQRLHRQDATTAERQRMTLREGEGIAVSLNNLTGLVYRFMVTLTVRVAATGACHTYTFPVTPAVLPLFSLLNGSGSGVVLEVVSLAYREIGTGVIPQIALEPIDGIGDGDTLTPVPLDSTASIGTIVAKRNAKILMRGAKHGALISVPHEQWQISVGYGTGPGLANLTSDLPFFRQAKPYPNELDIVLREGEGIAITYKNAGSLGRMRHAITFTVDGPVYPAEADVRDGEFYGPNGTDYEGTLVVSGGGNTYSRGRVVNA